LGNEFLDYAINPFVAGVYAGSPEQLSVQPRFRIYTHSKKNYGGLIKGQILAQEKGKNGPKKRKDRSRLFSYTNGMQRSRMQLEKNLGTEFT